MIASADESWPNRPIRMVVPVAAGGGVDIMARIMATPVSQALGQSVVIEDIGGAGGAIGANMVAKADPDGYTLLFAGPGQAALPALHRHLAYDTEKDFAGVSLVAQFPLVLVINPNVPANNLAEFVALLKANPGKYTFGSSGVGGSSHIPVELFKRLAGVDVLHVPFRGNSKSSAALVSGQIDMIIDGLAPQLGNIKAGRVRPLGVTTLKRSSFLPDVPAISEVLPGYEYPMWVAVFAPAKTPVAIVDKLSANNWCGSWDCGNKKALQRHQCRSGRLGTRTTRSILQKAGRVQSRHCHRRAHPADRLARIVHGSWKFRK